MLNDLKYKIILKRFKDTISDRVSVIHYPMFFKILDYTAQSIIEDIDVLNTELQLELHKLYTSPGIKDYDTCIKRQIRTITQELRNLEATIQQAQNYQDRLRSKLQDHLHSLDE